MNKPTPVNEAIAGDILNFLKKTWATTTSVVDGDDKSEFAGAGQQEMLKYVESYLRYFMQLMGRQYRRTDDDANEKSAQNIVWKKLTWNKLYRFITNVMKSDENASLGPKDFVELLKDPTMRRVEKNIGFTTALTPVMFNSTDAISPIPYLGPNAPDRAKRAASRVNRYASQDLAQGLIGLACERLVAIDYGLVDRGKPEKIKNEKPARQRPSRAKPPQNSKAQDAVAALTNLGYNAEQARQVVDRAFSELGKDAAVNDVVKAALKSLGRPEPTPSEKFVLRETTIVETARLAQHLTFGQKCHLLETVINADTEITVSPTTAATLDMLLECLQITWEVAGWQRNENADDSVTLKRV